MIDKNKMKDEKGRYIVQGLFLEDRYNPDMAIFTFDGEDKEYKGKTFISLKKRFLEESDPTEYAFATKWCYDWKHWKRMCNNKVLIKHIEEWREELNLALAAEGVLTMIDLGTDGKHYQAAKWLADNGWSKNERGRPSKEQIEGEIQRRADEQSEWDEDNGRVLEFIERKK